MRKLRTLDFLETPDYAVSKEFLRQLPEGAAFVEPCAGRNRFLVKALEAKGLTCLMDYDLNFGDTRKDARWTSYDIGPPTMFITNPPYSYWMLTDIICNLRQQAPTWLLLPADFMHRRQSNKHMAFCETVVSAGQISWFGGSRGRKNFAWYKFVADEVRTEFIPLDPR